MIETIIIYVQSIISEYGAWGVFLATIIEEIIAPVPSPLIPLAAGFFLLPSTASFVEIMWSGVFEIAIPVAVGISIGSTFIYSLGFFGGKPLIEKSKKWTGIKWEEIEKLEKHFTKGKGDEITLFILRMLPIVPGVAISGLCGVMRYSFRKFIIITCVGTFIRAFILGIVGWQVGELYGTYADMISRFEKYILVGVLVMGILFLVGLFLYKKNKKDTV